MSTEQTSTNKDGRETGLSGAADWLPLVRAQKEYIELLTAELSEASPLLAIHGWTSNRFAAGRLAREKIAIAEAAANDKAQP